MKTAFIEDNTSRALRIGWTGQAGGQAAAMKNPEVSEEERNAGWSPEHLLLAEHTVHMRPGE
jgi:hypothetical protein